MSYTLPVTSSIVLSTITQNISDLASHSSSLSSQGTRITSAENTITSHTSSISSLTTVVNGFVAQKAVANGLCELDSAGSVPLARLPAFMRVNLPYWTQQNLDTMTTLGQSLGDVGDRVTPLEAKALGNANGFALLDGSAYLKAANFASGRITATMCTTNQASALLALDSGAKIGSSYFGTGTITTAALASTNTASNVCVLDSSAKIPVSYLYTNGNNYLLLLDSTGTIPLAQFANSRITAAKCVTNTASGLCALDGSGYVPLAQLNGITAAKCVTNAASALCALDGSGYVPLAQLNGITAAKCVTNAASALCALDASGFVPLAQLSGITAAKCVTNAAMSANAVPTTILSNTSTNESPVQIRSDVL